ncbi:MAG: polysaccharide lyase family 8 super-sandwich domain-containing protein [Planctomycetia bacterium]|nr:polysaccharide lyase family 8 super-sandwich domain-containing protein [Planctomycetia bacterium]
MKSRFIFGLILILSAVPFSLFANEAKDDSAIIGDHIRARLLKGKNVRNFPDLQADGTWSDVDYKNKTPGNWRTMQHLNRAKILAADPATHKEAVRALESWLKMDPKNSNWWWASIGVPSTICDTFFLLGDALPKDLLAAYRPILDRSKPGMTGENKVWVAQIHLQKGILYKDPQMIREGCEQILSELRIVPFGTEGIQEDLTFHQHGSQLQIGNYGLSFFHDMVEWAHLLDGSSYQFTPEQIHLLDRLFWEMGRMVLYRGLFDYSACGRQIGINAASRKFNSLYGSAQALIPLLSKERQKLYKETMPGKRSVVVLRSAWYPCSAFLIHRPLEDYYFSVRMCTPKIIGSETVNSENASGRFQADGSTFLMKSAKEYQNIMPYWSWRHIPGTTELQDDQPLKARGIRNKSGFACGLAGDRCAIAAMKFVPDDLSAYKIWFCFPDRIVCRGFGIQSVKDSEVHTTIDQTALLGPVRIRKEGKEIEAGEGTTDLSGASSVLHNGTEYTLPKKGSCFLKIGLEQGNIQTINAAEPSDPRSGKIFLLVCNHGKSPKGAAYDYRIDPLGKNKSGENDLQDLKTSSNQIHAVHDPISKITLIAAFKPGKVDLPDGSEKILKKPALIIIQNGSEKSEQIKKQDK